ncbi:aspartate carbamoyltransferase regulatory subunit [Reinekea sp.]|uniref:aspartate carbamoyltransferase regulatory subunit n=1 Tax=Reinekea sp. TaxID=1970455 RepID=UPI002A83E77F|nr:aspartate carbamoyltransferase regulatory subunit [Reinekea sp.]
MRETMAVEAIETGTVIDHIPAGQGLNILARIQSHNAQARVTVGLNLPSKGSGQKDIIKVEGWLFSEQDAAEMALYAPKATVNIIQGYRVVNKFQIGLPSAFVDIFACPNSNCISHAEPVSSRFYVKADSDSVQLRCHFCERSFSDSLFKH